MKSLTSQSYLAGGINLLRSLRILEIDRIMSNCPSSKVSSCVIEQGETAPPKFIGGTNQRERNVSDESVKYNQHHTI